MAYAGTGYAVARTEYGGFWVRVVAALIDGVLLAVVGFVLGLVLADRSTESLVSTVVGWLYYAGMESSARQATLGKTAMGLAVTDLSGGRISFLRATGRHFAKILSALILLIGFVMVAFTEKKQGLHDMIASTLVVKTQ